MSSARRVLQGSERNGVLNIADPLLWQPGKPVVFLSGCSWACSGGAQRPVALARAVGAMGHPVIYHSKEDSVTQWAGGPIVLNKASMEKLLPQLEKAQGVVIMALVEYAEIAKKLQKAGWTVVYDVIDDWCAFQKGGNATWYDEQAEVKSLRQADVLTCSAPRLQEIVRQQIGREAHLVRNAGPAAPLAESEWPAQMTRSAKGNVVYVGAMWGGWFDWALLDQTARDLPRMQFTMIGDFTRHNQPVRRANIEYIDNGVALPYPEAMQYLSHADVAIIPFKDEKVCASVDPVKWYDHVAARVWTVGSGLMTDIAGRPWTLVAPKGAKTLAPEIRVALTKERPSSREAREYLAENSWAVRARQMMEIVGRENCDVRRPLGRVHPAGCSGPSPETIPTGRGQRELLRGKLPEDGERLPSSTER